MNRLRMLLVATALLVTAGGSSLASAQPYDHDGRGDRDRYGDRDRRDNHDDGRYFRFRDDGGRYFRYRDDRRFADRDDRWFHDRDYRWFRDRDDRRFYDRDDHYFVGERRWINGYNWTWDGDRWCRRDKGVVLYFGF